MWMFDMCVFFFKHKTAYEMRISDGSSDVCSSDLQGSRLVSAGCGNSPCDIANRPAARPSGGGAPRAARDRERPAADDGARDSADPPAPTIRAAEYGRASGRERVCQYV